MTSAADRQRRHRRRKREDKIVVKIEISRGTRETLVDADWLGAWDEDRPSAVQAVMQRVADGLSRRNG